MNATQQLHALGQSLRLDTVTHTLLSSGPLAHYIGAVLAAKQLESTDESPIEHDSPTNAFIRRYRLLKNAGS